MVGPIQAQDRKFYCLSSDKEVMSKLKYLSSSLKNETLKSSMFRKHTCYALPND